MSLRLRGLHQLRCLVSLRASRRGFGFRYVQIKSRIYVWRLKADWESICGSFTRTSEAASGAAQASVWPPGGIQKVTLKCCACGALKG